MRRIELPVDEIVARYGADESTAVLGRAYGVDPVTIWNRLRAAGVKMRPRGGQLGNKNALGHRGNGHLGKPGGPLHVDRGYLGTYDREGSGCRIHRACWEAYYGPIPKDHLIHHIDEDKRHNAIENLACMLNSEHSRLHQQERVGA